MSVCPSLTFVSHALTVQDIEICFAPHDRGTFLVSGDQILSAILNPRLAAGTIALNRGTPCDSENWTNNPSYLENVQART